MFVTIVSMPLHLPLPVKDRRDLGGRRRLLGTFLVPPADEPWEPQGKPPPSHRIPVAGMDWAFGDLEAQHLDDLGRQKPEVGRRLGVRHHPGRLPVRPRAGQPAREICEVRVREPCPHAADRLEDVLLAVVGGAEDRAVGPGPLSPPGVGADDDKIEGIRKPRGVVALPLDPLPLPRTCPVERVVGARLADDPLKPPLDAGEVELRDPVGIIGYDPVGRGEVVVAGKDLFETFARRSG